MKLAALPVLLVCVVACSGAQASSSASGPTTGMRSAQALQDQVARGRAIVISNACGDCHGGVDNPAAAGWLTGAKNEADTFLVGTLKTYPKNLSPDSATGTGRLTERQIFNALRYGLRPETTPDMDVTSTIPGQGNHPLNADYLAPSMPWVNWRHMPDQDLWAIAAYLKHGLKPVSHKPPVSEAPPDKWADHFKTATYGPYPAAAHPTEYETALATPQVMRGRQLVLFKACSGCHGGNGNPANKGYLAGAATDGEFQIGPFRTRPRNITPDNVTGIGRFSERQIFNALRFGLRPGETPDVEITSTVPGQGNFPARPKYLAPPMPWPSWRHMSDEDLWAIAAYLKHGVKPVSNKIADSDGPPDFWASAYAERIGPMPAPAFPTVNERGSN